MSANIKRYPYAFAQSQSFLDRIRIRKFPIDLQKIVPVVEKITNTRILISPFSDYKRWAMQLGLNCSDSIKDAKCYYETGLSAQDVYIIVYNEKRARKRIRFSIAHEFAHILLGHLTDERTEISRGGLDDPTYYAMEGAANTFAGNLLAPPVLIQARIAGGTFNSYIPDLVRFFDLSADAVEKYRGADYRYWLTIEPQESEKRILARCKNWLFPRFCFNCHKISYSTGRDKRFCPICGESPAVYKNKEFEEMNYTGVELDGEKRILECPICGNTEFIGDGTFCIICGSSLVNLCTKNETALCGKPLPGNVRYCPYCGNMTTFLRDGALVAWDYKAPKDCDATIIGEEDADLPF